MSRPRTLQETQALAARLDDQFLGFIFDAVMKDGERSSRSKGKGTRSQTFKRGLLATMLLDTFECQDNFVAKALQKNRTSIADRANAVRALSVSNNFGFGVDDLTDMAAKMEEWRHAVIAGSEEPVDNALSGWNASRAGWSFYMASKFMSLRYPALSAEYVEQRDLEEIDEFEREVKAASRANDERAKRTKASHETARSIALETQKYIRKIAPDSPSTNGFTGIVEPSHPAVALIMRNRTDLKELAQMVCTEKAPPHDAKLKDLPHAICYAEPNPHPLKGEGKTAVRLWTKAHKDNLAPDVKAIMAILAREKFSPTLKMPPAESSRGKNSSYALVTVRA